jgi:lysophospholipase L1-like esterase
MKQVCLKTFLAGLMSSVALLAQAQPSMSADANTNSMAAMATNAAVVPTVRPNSAIIPNLSRGFVRAHTNNVAIAKQGGIDVLFMGDSITDWWRNPGRGQPIDGAIPYGGKAVFDKHFGSWKVANFGIAGDTTQGVLYRLQDGEGQGFQPKVIMLMIGTNNTGRNSPPEIAIGVADIVFEMRKDFPDAKILLLGIFPRKDASLMTKINEINKIIPALDDHQHVFYMDIGDKFLGPDGTIPKDIMSDGLHPTSKGYEIWANAVEGELTTLMQ